MSKSGGGRVNVDDGYVSDAQKPPLKKLKTTAIDYNVDALKSLIVRLKKNGVLTDHSKALDETSKQVLQKISSAYKILIKDEKELENKKIESITDEMKRLLLNKIKKMGRVGGDVQTFIKADENSDHLLCLNEFCKMLGVDSNDEDATELFNLFDQNGDGDIDMEEFLDMMRDPGIKQRQLYENFDDVIEEFSPPISIDTLNTLVSMYNSQQQSANSTNIHAYRSVKAAINEVNLPRELRTFLDSLREKTAEELEMFEKFFYIGSAFTKFLKEGNADELSFQDKQLFEYFTIKQRAMNNVPLTLLSLSQDF